jgi:hypothetical protein
MVESQKHCHRSKLQRQCNLEPTHMAEVYECFLFVGQAAGIECRAKEAVAKLQKCAAAIESLSENGLARVIESNPDVMVIVCCGLDIERTRQDLYKLANYPGFEQLACVRRKTLMSSTATHTSADLDHGLSTALRFARVFSTRVSIAFRVRFNEFTE